ncbi:hypothetical protein JFP838_pA0271 (plasmid) [Clostridium perfringens]|uniref:Uncharacterized protein n=1 Tax=Clostridium perfringens TaxID=1502 RepID=A0A140GRM8_CLOPF|nr:hypothetical protein JFP838_pA0271 [Clostridium perfringens]
MFNTLMMYLGYIVFGVGCIRIVLNILLLLKNLYILKKEL